MTTLDSSALWSATALAFDEKKLGAAGLSVRQRKLLTLLSQPASIPHLAQTIALPIEEVHAVLDRFAKLGFASSNAEAPINPMEIRVTAHSAAAAAPSRTPLFIGIAIAALAVVASAAWFLRSGSSASDSAQPVAANTAPKLASSTAAGPADSADLADSAIPRGISATATAPPVGKNVAPAAPAQTAPPAAPVSAVAAAVPPAARTTAPAPTPLPATRVAATPAQGSAAASGSAAAPVVAAPQAAAVAPPPVVVAAPAAAPVAAAPTVAPAAPTTVALAAPAVPAATRPATPAREIKLIERVEPGFPRSVDADKGSVKARLRVDAKGLVTGVDIIEAVPPRVFDRTVRNALQQWRYEPTGEPFTVQAELNFTR